jgi:hypothetical protein
MRMDAYLDQVTRGLVKNAAYLSIFDLDKALDLIRARPELAEQAALLNALEERLSAYGRSRGYLNPPPEKTDDERANTVTSFLLKDVFGFKHESANDKALSEFKKLMKDFVKSGLNAKGKSAFKFLEIIWKLCNAKSPKDAAAILIKEGGGLFAAWFASNSGRLAVSGLKAAGVSPVVRNRLMKLIAARLAWGETILARLRWVNPWLIALDILLTPEDTATDDEEWRLAFLTVYGRLFTTQSEVLGKLVRSCTGNTWQLAMPIDAALQIAIGPAR